MLTGRDMTRGTLAGRVGSAKRTPRVVVVAGLLAALAAANFLWGLGASSLYVDEGFSWSAASAPLSDVVQRVRESEVAPPTYYLGLHQVLGRVSDSEAALRLPSALAAIALVLVVFWVGYRVSGLRPAVFAAALTALSPLVLEYGQQARAYIFAMLAVAVAVGCVLEYHAAGPGRRRTRWLAGAIGACILALWLHYTAALIVAPLVVLFLRSSTATRRDRLAFVGATVAGWLVTVPLMRDQMDRGHEAGVAPAARVTAENLVELLGTPFVGRFGGTDLTLGCAVGALALTVAAVLTLRTDIGRRAPALRSLVLPLDYAPVVAVIVLSLVGSDVMITRYTAVAAPFMLVLLGAVLAFAARPLAIALGVLAAAGAVAGSLAAHSRDGHYPDLRGAAEYISAGAARGDGVVLTGATGIDYSFRYHARQGPIEQLPITLAGSPDAVSLARKRRRLWFVQIPPLPPSRIATSLQAAGYRLDAAKRFDASADVQVVRASPR